MYCESTIAASACAIACMAFHSKWIVVSERFMIRTVLRLERWMYVGSQISASVSNRTASSSALPHSCKYTSSDDSYFTLSSPRYVLAISGENVTLTCTQSHTQSHIIVHGSTCVFLQRLKTRCGHAAAALRLALVELHGN